MPDPTATDAPRQRQMLLPFLEAIADAGGRAATRDLCGAVAERLGVEPAVRAERQPCGAAGSINVFDRSVRWAAQRAKLLGLARPVGGGDWEITGKGRKAAGLRASAPTTLVTIFATEKGVALWGSCEDAVTLLDDGEVDLIFTSPPYPLLTRKSYGNVTSQEYVDWFLRLADPWPRKLAKTGSLVLNLADVQMPGAPEVSLYQEELLLALRDRLGLRLCQKWYWQNPSKLPCPAHYVTINPLRGRTSVEQIYWLSADPASAKADTTAVLQPYSDSMLRRLAGGGEGKGRTRPSGHVVREGAFSRDRGGATPYNLITEPNTRSGTPYTTACKAAGLPVHPARFPKRLPDFFIRMLTVPDDLVVDPFGGSSKTGAVAEALGRRWVTSEKVLDYVLGAALRFQGAPGFERFDCAA